MAVDREALEMLRARRFDSPSSSSSSAVVSTFGVTSNSLSGTKTVSVTCCTAASTVAGKLLVLTVLWLIIVYTLCRGAADIASVVDVTAVFVTNANLVYIMSWHQLSWLNCVVIPSPSNARMRRCNTAVLNNDV